MVMKLTKRPAFWLGFSLALGMLLAASVVALATGGSPRTRVPTSSGPLKETLAAFSEEAGSDPLPAAIVAAAQALTESSADVPDAARPGSLDLTKGRLLLDHLGSQGMSLYAVPTDKGEACGFLTDYGTIGCAHAFTDQAPVAWNLADVDGFGSGSPPILAGLLPNDVTAVKVLVDGVEEAAVVGNNGFFYELPRNDAWPKVLVVVHQAGGVDTVTLPSAPPLSGN